MCEVTQVCSEQDALTETGVHALQDGLGSKGGRHVQHRGIGARRIHSLLRGERHTLASHPHLSAVPHRRKADRFMTRQGAAPGACLHRLEDGEAQVRGPPLLRVDAPHHLRPVCNGLRRAPLAAVERRFASSR